MPGPEATPKLPAPLLADFATDPTLQEGQNPTLDLDPVRNAAEGKQPTAAWGTEVAPSLYQNLFLSR